MLRNRIRQWRQIFGFIALILALVLAIWQAPEPGPSKLPAEVTGTLATIDGDSFHLDGREIRLVGIDAPEGRQTCDKGGRAWPCGQEAEARLRQLVGRRQVHCKPEKTDRYRRLLAVCYLGATEVNRWMVAEGWAVAYGRYEAEEAAARQAKRGIWASRFERPRAWRDVNNAALLD